MSERTPVHMPVHTHTHKHTHTHIDNALDKQPSNNCMQQSHMFAWMAPVTMMATSSTTSTARPSRRILWRSSCRSSGERAAQIRLPRLRSQYEVVVGAVQVQATRSGSLSNVMYRQFDCQTPYGTCTNSLPGTFGCARPDRCPSSNMASSRTPSQSMERSSRSQSRSSLYTVGGSMHACMGSWRGRRRVLYDTGDSRRLVRDRSA